MLTCIDSIELQYAPDQVLNSQQSSNIHGSTFSVDVPVGGMLSLPPEQRKLKVVEKIGPVTVERWFMEIDDQLKGCMLAPVSMRVIDPDEVHEVLFKKGLDESYEVFNHGFTVPKNSKFLKNLIAEGVVSDLYVHDKCVHDSVKEFLEDTPSDMATITNECCYREIPSPTDRVVAGYPWNIANFNSNQVQVLLAPRNTVGQLSSWISDLSMQVSLFDMPYSHPLFAELASVFHPQFGDYYADMVKGPIHQACKNESLIPADWIRRYGGVYTPDYQFPSPSIKDEQAYVPLTEYSSDILQLCSIFKLLPVTELSLEYILPTRDKYGILSPVIVNILHMVPIRSISRKELELELATELQRICAYWDSTLDKISLYKTKSDVLYMKLEYLDNKVTRYKLDLTVASLLTQTISRFD